jgi:hypothetical protein
MREAGPHYQNLRDCLSPWRVILGEPRTIRRVDVRPDAASSTSSAGQIIFAGRLVGGGMIKRAQERQWRGCAFLVFLALGGCQVHLISDYDDATDVGVTEVQQAIDHHLWTLETLSAVSKETPSLSQQCDPRQFSDSYREIQSHLRTLIIRNEVRAQNEKTTEQLKLLDASIENLRKQQMERYSPTDSQRAIEVPGDRCMSAAQLKVSRDLLEQHIRSILKLELAKRNFRSGE